MRLTQITNYTSFTSAIPVKYMVRGSDGQFKKAENAKEAERCQLRTTKMLNSSPNDLTAKGQRFIEFYKKWDREYAQQPVVTSHVPSNQIWHTYLITGPDAVRLNGYGDEIGATMRQRKCEANEMPPKIAKKYLDDAMAEAKKRYCQRAEGITKNRYAKLKDADGDDVCMIVYYDKVYGKRSGKVTDYKFYTARVMKSNIVAEHEAFLARQEAEQALERQEREKEQAQIEREQEIEEAIEEYRNAPAFSKLGYEPIDRDFMIPDEEEERFYEAGGQNFDFYQDMPDPVFEPDVAREVVT